MATCIALLRGINVGRAKPLAMADVHALVEGLGCANVRTLLNSGNIVFNQDRPNTKKLSAQIELAIEASAGFSVPTMVMTRADLRKIVASNGLSSVVTDPSKHLVAFVSESNVLKALAPMVESDWSPESLHVGPKAAYLWCPILVIDSKLVKALTKTTKFESTTRNWTTVIRLQALADER